MCPLEQIPFDISAGRRRSAISAVLVECQSAQQSLNQSLNCGAQDSSRSVCLFPQDSLIAAVKKDTHADPVPLMAFGGERRTLSLSLSFRLSLTKVSFERIRIFRQYYGIKVVERPLPKHTLDPSNRASKVRIRPYLSKFGSVAFLFPSPPPRVPNDCLSVGESFERALHTLCRVVKLIESLQVGRFETWLMCEK